MYADLADGAARLLRDGFNQNALNCRSECGAM